MPTTRALLAEGQAGQPHFGKRRPGRAQRSKQQLVLVACRGE
jgi:hypothetical protein